MRQIIDYIRNARERRIEEEGSGGSYESNFLSRKILSTLRMVS